MRDALINLDQFKVYIGLLFSWGCLVCILIPATHFFFGFATFMRRLEMYLKWSHCQCCEELYMRYTLILESFLRRLGWFVLPSRPCIQPMPMMSPLLERSLPRSTMYEKKSGLKLTAINMLTCSWIPWIFYRTDFLNTGCWKILGFLTWLVSLDGEESVRIIGNGINYVHIILSSFTDIPIASFMNWTCCALVVSV